MTFSRYAVEFVDIGNRVQLGTDAPTSALIGVSVSGGVTRTIEGVLRAKQRGLRTFAVTSNDQTPIAKAADAVLTTRAPDVPNATGVQVPGARSYFASLVMLHAVALRIGEARGREVSRERMQLRATADGVRKTIERSDHAARELARETLDANEFVFCGSGPNYATAQFCAAKMLEATGDPAVSQDIEEWAHLQYFAKAADTPTFLITAGHEGRDASRADEVRTAMETIGRHVVDVSPDEENVRSKYSLPYALCPEAFAPLVACIPVMLFASYRAELLSEPYFRAFGGGRSIEHGGGISRIRTSKLVV